MTLIAFGLLLEIVGLIWMLVVSILQSDRQSERQGPPRPAKPIMDAAHRAAKAA